MAKSKSGEFYTFDEVLRQLNIDENRLKRLVSEGEIRAFRQGDTMKLRRADVENLRNELTGGEVVDLGDVQEDLVFEDDVEVAEDAGMATQEIGMATDDARGAETVIEEPDEETEPDEEAAAAPVRAARAAEVPEEYEGGLLRALLVLTTLLLVLGLPLALAMSTGKLNALASGISGILK